LNGLQYGNAKAVVVAVVNIASMNIALDTNTIVLVIVLYHYPIL
jgi:hypothetical protein